MNPAEWLQRTARRQPDAPALLEGTACRATYADFARRVAQLAAALRERHGLRPGDRLAIYMPNATAYLEALYAAWHAGAVAVPINAKLHPREAAWILADSGARFVVAPGATCAALADHLPPGVEQVIDPHGADWDAMASGKAGQPAPAPMQTGTLVWLFYTSGTTGRPKGVMITAGNIAAMVACYFMDVDEVRAEDVGHDP